MHYFIVNPQSKGGKATIFLKKIFKEFSWSFSMLVRAAGRSIIYESFIIFQRVLCYNKKVYKTPDLQ